jgi:hypothetical protein
MKIPPSLSKLRSLGAWLAGLTVFTGALQGAPFLYAPGDLVLAFRQTGGASDYVVNIGKATNYVALSPGTTVTVTNLSVTQFNAAFASVNSLRWSVGAANRPPVDTNYPLQTLWVARPRLDQGVPATPWLRKSQASQGLAGAQVDGVGYNAGVFSSTQTAGPNNTATGVLVATTHSFNISQVIGAAGNYANTFQGNVETLTPVNFADSAANVSRADLFELLPGSFAGGTLDTPGRHLGHFELKPDRTLTFTALSTGPIPPLVTAVTHTNGVTTVSVTSVIGSNYRLRAANTLTTPVSTWTVIGSFVPGTGHTLSLQDTSTVPARFFAVEAQ